jgi:hypothetical protein
MSDEPADWAEMFRGYSDEYLLDRVTSGGMTADALRVAQAELKQRGIPVPAVNRESQPASDENAELGPFVTVARFMVPTQAHIVRGRLEAEGIPALIADGNFVQNNELLSTAVGGVRLQVPATLVGQANEILAAIRTGSVALQDDVELKPDDE